MSLEDAAVLHLWPSPPVSGSRTVVIGAGFGGLATALRARTLGQGVVVHERLDQPGGPARVFRRDGYSFDACPTVPFIVQLVALIPLMRPLAGTSIGMDAAIVLLAIAATPYLARVAEMSLREVDPGLIEAVRAMDGSRLTIVREVLLPEACPGLIAGFTVMLVTLIGASAMAGTVGAGGLGDLAICYGYQRFRSDVMAKVVAIVGALQWFGD